MKRVLALLAVCGIAVAALYVAQRRPHRDAVGPDAILAAAADFQRDLTRAPMRWTRIPDSAEIRIGNQLAALVIAGEPHGMALAPSVGSDVSVVGQRLAAHAHRKLPYRFHVVANPDLINAFALPGGHVFVGLGMLRQMTSEDELAFVLGHEIEHVDHYHAAERVQVEAQLKRLDLDAIAGLAQLPLGLWQQGYSKDQEMEADREGLRLAATAGYSAQGALNLLDRLEALQRAHATRATTPVDELSHVAVAGLEGYFASHPPLEDRLAQVRAVIAADSLDTAQPLRPLEVSSSPR